MIKKIFILTDYLGRFESKYNDTPYMSGMDINLISEYFAESGVISIIFPFKEVKKNYRSMVGQSVIYTSSEDPGLYYKSFIEDIILFLEVCGANVIPKYPLLRSNNNKVMMELVRELMTAQEYKSLETFVFGELSEFSNTLLPPMVIKESAGAQSREVYLAINNSLSTRLSKKASNSFNLINFIKNKVRAKKHANYKPESQYRKKFIAQKFIPNLTFDFKVLLFGRRAYILRRGIKDDDFRASGSHWNYLLGEKSDPPSGIFDFCNRLKIALDVPNISVDVAYDGTCLHLIEFQCLYFGSYTQRHSDCFFELNDTKWLPKYEELELEKVYVDGILDYLKMKDKLIN